MMRGTPRTFVGTVTLHLEGDVCRHDAQAIRDQVEQLPGVLVSAIDPAGGRVSVTAQRPVDLGEIIAAVERAGARVRS